MSVSLASLLKSATRLNFKGPNRPTPTHETMLHEHERRKAAEVRQRIAHEKCFVGAQRICG